MPYEWQTLPLVPYMAAHHKAPALLSSAVSERACNASLQLRQQPIRAQNGISREKSTERNIIERYEYS